MRDYLTEAKGSDLFAARLVEPEDAEQSGVKGMKWGVRRSSKELKSAAAQREGTKKPEAKKAPPSGETSQLRYARLAAAAKAGNSHLFSDEDISFFNKRTEAIKKIDAMNESDPGWIKKTAAGVRDEAAKKALQKVADTVVEKYITGPVTKKITAAGAR